MARRIEDPVGGRRRVHMLNISATGALVYGRDAPEPGSIVTLHGALEFGQARIAWRKDKCFGIAFLRPICAQQIARIAEAQRNLVEGVARRAHSSTAATQLG